MLLAEYVEKKNARLAELLKEDHDVYDAKYEKMLVNEIKVKI